MEQKKIPKNVQKYIIAYRFLLDAMDEHREEILESRRKDCRPERKKEIRERVASRCRREGWEVFRRIPRQEKRFRRLRWIKWLCWLGGSAGLGCSIALFIQAAVSRQLIFLLIGLIALTVNRICAKGLAVAQDVMVWSVMEHDYQPHQTVWSEKQKQLLPERLHPYVEPLSCTVEPEDCVRGRLRCLCGSTVFSMWRHPTQGYLRAVCPDCKREIVLFDEHLDARGADGQAQQYFPNALQTAVCRICESELHRVTVTVLSDAERSFFQEKPVPTAESGYCILFEMHCASCGQLTGDGRYLWNPEDERKEEQNL